MRPGLRPELRGARVSLPGRAARQAAPATQGRSPVRSSGLGVREHGGQTRTSGSLDALDVLARCPGALLAARQHGRTRAPQPDRDGASRASLAQNEHVNSNQETRDGAPPRRGLLRTLACGNHRDCASLPRESVARGLHARRRGRHARRDEAQLYHCFANRAVASWSTAGYKAARDADDGLAVLQALTTAFIDHYRDRLAFFRLDFAWSQIHGDPKTLDLILPLFNEPTQVVSQKLRRGSNVTTLRAR